MPTIVPPQIANHPLAAQMKRVPPLLDAVLSIRERAERIIKDAAAHIRHYTDHSLEHMDALWQTSLQVLTDEEIDSFLPEEAFLLSASFYLHDLGMFAPAFNKWIIETKQSDTFKTLTDRFISSGITPDEASALAIAEFARKGHADMAVSLAVDLLPGTQSYLIENESIRSKWGHLLGVIAASHGWSLNKVDSELGKKGIASVLGQKVDPAYVACILRITDAANIDHTRAPFFAAALRQDLGPTSKRHWQAQHFIGSAIRSHDYISLSSTAPLETSDAWWLFFDLATYLDSELRSVRAYLSDRSASTGRFSLNGVRGIEDPTTFALYVSPPPNVVPIDVRVMPGSMEQIVGVLGGSHLYGEDRFAPIRELLQNSRDAIELRTLIDRQASLSATPGLISVRVHAQGNKHLLTVSDNGVGMDRVVLTRFLIAVASQYWRSPQFASSVTRDVLSDFHPVGKFGIGFLSVFMLGDSIEVETRRDGHQGYLLRLEGLGCRGQLIDIGPGRPVGTSVTIVLKDHFADLSPQLANIVRAKAPMLDIPIDVYKLNEQSPTRISPGWWKSTPRSELIQFVRDWPATSKGLDEAGRKRWHRASHLALRGDDDTESGWPGEPPEASLNHGRLFFCDSSGGRVLWCSRGFAIDVTAFDLTTGVYELGEVELNAARTEVIEEIQHTDNDLSRTNIRAGHIRSAIHSARPSAVAGLIAINAEGMIPSRLAAIRMAARKFGPEILEESNIPWLMCLESPGNLVLRTSAEVTSALGLVGNVIMVFDGDRVDLSKVLKRFRNRRDTLLVSVADKVSVNYEVKRRLEREHDDESVTITGTLDSVLDTCEIEFSKLPLLPAALLTVQAAWSVSRDDLDSSKKWSLELGSSLLSVHLSRERKVPSE